MIKTNIPFNKYYKFFNLLSSVLVIISLCLLIFKGLNFGVDFKGGTLIELRASDSKINVSTLRDKFNQMKIEPFQMPNVEHLNCLEVAFFGYLH